MLGGLGLALGIAACDPDTSPPVEEQDVATVDAERLVPRFCETAERCDCAQDITNKDCLTNRTTIWEDRIAEGRERELTYDADCFEAQVASAESYVCAAAGKYEAHLCESFCAVFHGDKELGESCDGYDDIVSDCSAGLTCANGTCSEPCEQLTGLAVGQRCMTEEGESIEDCAQGLTCNYETYTCLALPEIGSPCTGQCTNNAYCDQTGFCIAAAGVGADCRIPQCASGLYCSYNYDGFNETATCRAYAQAGQSCVGEDIRCDSGLGCGVEGLCRGPGQVGESCGGLGCLEGLVCNFEIDQCLAAPTEAGFTCLQGECGGGLWCDISEVPEGICSAVLPTGDRCSGHSQCESGYCPNAFCADRPALGAPCAGAGVCQRGLTCDGAVCIEAAIYGPAVCAYDGF